MSTITVSSVMHLTDDGLSVLLVSCGPRGNGFVPSSSSHANSPTYSARRRRRGYARTTGTHLHQAGFRVSVTGDPAEVMDYSRQHVSTLSCWITGCLK